MSKNEIAVSIRNQVQDETKAQRIMNHVKEFFQDTEISYEYITEIKIYYNPKGLYYNLFIKGEGFTINFAVRDL